MKLQLEKWETMKLIQSLLPKPLNENLEIIRASWTYDDKLEIEIREKEKEEQC